MFPKDPERPWEVWVWGQRTTSSSASSTFTAPSIFNSHHVLFEEFWEPQHSWSNSIDHLGPELPGEVYAASLHLNRLPTCALGLSVSGQTLCWAAYTGFSLQLQNNGQSWVHRRLGNTFRMNGSPQIDIYQNRALSYFYKIQGHTHSAQGQFLALCTGMTCVLREFKIGFATCKTRILPPCTIPLAPVQNKLLRIKLHLRSFKFDSSLFFMYILKIPEKEGSFSKFLKINDV